LKNNIDVNAAEIVPLSKGYSIIVMPINDKVKEVKKLEAGSSLVFIATINAKGEVKWANIVYYKPAAHQSVKKLDASAMERVLTGKPTDQNGIFYFLSISGRRQSQAEYRNGQLYSNGVLSTGSDDGKKTAGLCVDWWLVITIRPGDGTCEVFREYIGQTCSSDCDDPSFMSLCPAGEGGGGDMGCSYTQEEALELLGDAYFTPSTKDPAYSYGTAYDTEDDDYNPVQRWPKNSTLEIGSYYIGGSLITYSANFTGVIERSSTTAPWKWIQFAYANTVQSGGTTSACIKPETITTCSTSMDPDGFKARTSIIFNYKGTVVCVTGNMQGQAPKSDIRSGSFIAAL
jgi:hypothetical protein